MVPRQPEVAQVQEDLRVLLGTARRAAVDAAQTISHVVGVRQGNVIEILLSVTAMAMGTFTVVDKWRRKHEREPFSMVVDYSTEDRAPRDYIQNVSAGGMFIETRIPFTAGQEVSLTVSQRNLDAAFLLLLVLYSLGTG